MNRFTGLILAMAVGTAMSACASAGTTGNTGTPTAQAESNFPPGTEPSDNDFTEQASRSLGIAMLRQDAAEKRTLYQEALAAAQQAIATAPGNPKGWYLAGQAYAGLGQYVAADSAFDKAQEIYPAYEPEIEPDREQAWIQAYNTGVEALQRNDIETAIKQMEMADAIYQGRPEARLNLGSFYARQDQTDKAVEAYRGALEILTGPKPAGLDSAGVADWRESEEMATLNLAQLLAATDRLPEAEQTYRDFLETHPNHLQAKVNLAEVVARQGKAAEAGTMYEELLASPDLGADDYLMIGVGLFQAENYKGAAAAFRKSVERNPYARDGHYNLAQALYVRAGELDDAKKTATDAEVEAIEAELVQIHTQLAQAGEKVLELDPFNRNIIAYLARAYQSLSQLSPEAGAQEKYRGKVQEALKRHEAFDFEVSNLTIYPGNGQVRVNAVVKNLKLEAGTPVTLRVTMLDDAGTVIGSGDVTVNVAAANMPTPFEVQVPVTGDLAGWKYERVN